MPTAYVTAAHGLASYEAVAGVLRGLDSLEAFAHWFCTEAVCVERFDQLGSSDYVREMFAKVSTEVGLQAQQRAHALQRRHGLRARMWELDRFEDLSESDLVRLLAAEARRTPFTLLGDDLEAWLGAFAGAAVVK